MRLTHQQHFAILESAWKIFGDDATVRLFGSRTDDQKKGGDIDLLISASEEKMLYHNKILFLVDVKLKLGDRKIDVVFDRADQGSGRFLEFIKESGISL